MTPTNFIAIERQFLDAEEQYQLQTCAQIIARLRSETTDEANRWAGYFESRLAMLQGQLERANEHLEALRVADSVDETLTPRLNLALGIIAARQGQLATALSLFQAALNYFQGIPDDYFITVVQLEMANAYRDAALLSRQIIGNIYNLPSRQPQLTPDLKPWLYFLQHLPLTLFLWWRTRQPITRLPHTIIPGQSEVVDIRMTSLVAEALVRYRLAEETTTEEVLKAEIAIQRAKLWEFLYCAQVARQEYQGLLHNPVIEGNPYHRALIQHALGHTLLMLGSHEEAAVLFIECVGLFEQVDDWRSQVNVLVSQARIAQVQQDDPTAIEAYKKCLSITRQRGNMADRAFLMGAINSPFSSRPRKTDQAAAQNILQALQPEMVPLYLSPMHQPYQRFVNAGYVMGLLIYIFSVVPLVIRSFSQTFPSVGFLLLPLFLLISSNWLPWLVAIALTKLLPKSADKMTRPLGLILLQEDNIAWMDMAGHVQTTIAYDEVTRVSLKGQTSGERASAFYSTTTLYAEPEQKIEISGFTVGYQQLQSQLRMNLEARTAEGSLLWQENKRFSWRSGRTYLSLLLTLFLTIALLVTGLAWQEARDSYELLGDTPLLVSTFWGTAFMVFLLLAVTIWLLPALGRAAASHRRSPWPFLVFFGGLVILSGYFLTPMIKGLARPFSLMLVAIGFWWVIQSIRWLLRPRHWRRPGSASRTSIWLPRLLLVSTLLLLTKFLWIDVRQSLYMGMFHIAQIRQQSYQVQTEYLAQAEAIMPDDPWVYYWTACVHSAQEEYTAVLQDAAKGLNSGTRNRLILGGLYMRQGSGHYDLGQYDLALTDFEQAQSYGYNAIVPRLALALFQLNRQSEAEQTLTAWQPLSTQDYAARAFVYHYYLSAYDLALDDYRHVRAEGDTDYIQDELELLTDLGQTETVLALLQEWQPETAAEFAARADYYKSFEDQEQVIRNLDEAIRLDPDNASHYYERAVAIYMLGHYAEAIVDIDAAIQRDPSQSVYYLSRAHAAYNLGNFAMAAADYTRAIEGGWDDDEYIELRGNAYYAIAEYEQAVADYLMLARHHPQSEFGPDIDVAARLMQTARDFLNEAAYDQALLAFQHALALDPVLSIIPEAEVALAQGRAFSQDGQIEAALTAYQTAISLDPTLTIIPEDEVSRRLTAQAQAFIYDGQYDAALAAYYQAIEVNPALDIIPEAELAIHRAYQLAYAGEFEAALVSFQEAEAADPHQPIAYESYLAQQMVSAAYSLVVDERYDEAVEMYRWAVLLDPALRIVPEAAVAQTKGIQLAYAGDTAAALAALQEAQRLNPALDLDPAGEIANILITQASGQIYAGYESAALELLQQAAAINPDARLVPEAQLALFQAQGLASEGNFDQALTLYREAVTLDPDLDLVPEREVARQMVYLAGSTIYEEDYGTALSLYQQAVALDPSLDLIPEMTVAVEKGQMLAYHGRLYGAIAALDEAYAWMPTLPISTSRDLAAAYGVICDASHLPRYGETVIQGCRRMVDIALGLDDFSLNFRTCINGETDAFLDFVLPACERAITLAQDDLHSSILVCQLFSTIENLASSVLPACQRVQHAASLLTFAETVSGSIDEPKVWRFRGEAGQIVTIIADSIDGEAQLILSLYGPDFEFVEISAYDESVILPVTGIYYIDVEAVNPTISSYTIRLEVAGE